MNDFKKLYLFFLKNDCILIGDLLCLVFIIKLFDLKVVCKLLYKCYLMILF